MAVLRQNSVRRQVIDLSALIRRRSRLNGHSPAPPASTSPDALRRPPSGRPGEPCSTPPTRRLQEDGEPAEVAQQRSAVLGRVVQGVGRLEARSRPRVPQHRPAVAAPPLPRVLGRTLRSPRGGTPARKPPDPGSRRTNGSGQSSLGRASHPWRTAEAGNRGGRAYGLPAALDAAHTAVPDVANVPRQPCPGPSLHRFLHSPDRGLSGTLCPCRAPSPSPPGHPLQRDRASHLAVDGPADHGRLPERHPPAKSPPRSRPSLRRALPAPSEGPADRGSPHHPPQALAESPFLERLICPGRRHCPGHIVVLGGRHLRRTPTAYF